MRKRWLALSLVAWAVLFMVGSTWAGELIPNQEAAEIRAGATIHPPAGSCLDFSLLNCTIPDDVPDPAVGCPECDAVGGGHWYVSSDCCFDSDCFLPMVTGGWLHPWRSYFWYPDCEDWNSNYNPTCSGLSQVKNPCMDTNTIQEYVVTETYGGWRTLDIETENACGWVYELYCEGNFDPYTWTCTYYYYLPGCIDIIGGTVFDPLLPPPGAGCTLTYRLTQDHCPSGHEQKLIHNFGDPCGSGH